MDFFYFTEWKFARENNTSDSHRFPEFCLCPIRVICLYREMDLGFWIVLSNEIDEPRITHDKCIWLHIHHLLEVRHKWLDLEIMRIDICREVDLLSTRVTVFYCFCQCLPSELILTSSQWEHRDSCIDCISTIGDRPLELFKITSGHEEFEFFHKKNKIIKNRTEFLGHIRKWNSENRA